MTGQTARIEALRTRAPGSLALEQREGIERMIDAASAAGGAKIGSALWRQLWDQANTKRPRGLAELSAVGDSTISDLSAWVDSVVRAGPEHPSTPLTAAQEEQSVARLRRYFPEGQPQRTSFPNGFPAATLSQGFKAPLDSTMGRPTAPATTQDECLVAGLWDFPGSPTTTLSRGMKPSKPQEVPSPLDPMVGRPAAPPMASQHERFIARLCWDFPVPSGVPAAALSRGLKAPAPQEVPYPRFFLVLWRVPIDSVVDEDFDARVSTTFDAKEDVMMDLRAAQAHSQNTCTPCVFHFLGTCKKGKQCKFCHLPHSTAQIDQITVSKQTRRAVRRHKREAGGE